MWVWTENFQLSFSYELARAVNKHESGSFLCYDNITDLLRTQTIQVV